MLMTALARQYALMRDIVDRPNQRSSHSRTVPRGGGVGIVVTFLLVICLGSWRAYLDTQLTSTLVFGGSAVALIGLLDDCFDVTPLLRAAVHCVAAGWAVWKLGPLMCFDLGTAFTDLKGFDYLFTTFCIVWMINLYNFMDGIDGLAAVEGLTVSGLGGGLLFITGMHTLGAVSWILAATCSGFLVLNWPPARVFMGDTGSGFLGFVFGVLIVVSANKRTQMFWPWMILLMVFICDATVTLLRRVLSGEKWYEGHRSHAYQHLARCWRSHLKTTLTIAAVNVFWLMPLACMAFLRTRAGPFITALAAIPLILIAIKCRAGEEREL